MAVLPLLFQSIRNQKRFCKPSRRKEYRCPRSIVQSWTDGTRYTCAMVLRIENLLKKWHAATYYSSPRFGIFGLTKALIARLLARLLSELVLFPRSVFDIMAWPEKGCTWTASELTPMFQCAFFASLTWTRFYQSWWWEKYHWKCRWRTSLETRMPNIVDCATSVVEERVHYTARL